MKNTSLFLPIPPQCVDRIPCVKQPYPDKRAAQSARNQRLYCRQAGQHHRPAYLRIYWCRDCSGWHLTHRYPLGENAPADGKRRRALPLAV